MEYTNPINLTLDLIQTVDAAGNMRRVVKPWKRETPFGGETERRLVKLLVKLFFSHKIRTFVNDMLFQPVR